MENELKFTNDDSTSGSEKNNHTSWIENKTTEINYDEESTIGPLLCEKKLSIKDRSIAVLISAMIGKKFHFIFKNK